MSKQLLQTHGASVVVVGLNDRAFAIVKGGNEGDADDVVSASAFELMADDSAEVKSSGNKDSGNPREVQAVSCTKTGSKEDAPTCWVAVSREDKTLSLYSVDGSGTREAPTQLKPGVTYRLAKRARCLTFCEVGARLVVIAGDLSGDATAFPVPDAPLSEADDAPTKKGHRRLLLGHTASILTGLNVAPSLDGSGGATILTSDRDEKVRVSRFPQTNVVRGYLLGHTSFVSTMDAVASDRGGKRALCVTGSGDGTVRLWDYGDCKEMGMVPVAVVGQQMGKVGAGDDEGEGDEEDDAKMSAEECGNDDGRQDNEVEGNDEDEDFPEDDFDDEQEDEVVVAVPTSVSLSPDAGSVAVARDGICSIDVHPIPDPQASNTSAASLLLSRLVSLHAKTSLPCPSQPLAVRFLSDGSFVALLTGDGATKDYLHHYRKCDSNGKTEGTQANVDEYEDATKASPFCSALRDAIGDVAIDMPETPLERDADRGEYKLQKSRGGGGGDDDNDGDGGGGTSSAGLHWNDAGRKETARLAEQRRRKRKRGKREENEGEK